MGRGSDGIEGRIDRIGRQDGWNRANIVRQDRGGRIDRIEG